MRYVTSVERLATERGLQQGLQQGLRQGLQQGLEQGLQQGLQHGLKQEASAILKRQLTKRFGALAEATVSRINNATLEQIEIWADRVLEAKTLEDVFGEQ